jgi:uncharacterized repeat protein (TIGR02543 family)
VIVLTGDDGDKGGSSSDGSVKVSYYPNGGIGTPYDDKIEKGSHGVVSANYFVFSGYAFISWNMESDGSGIVYYPGTGISPASDIALYAQWKSNVVPDPSQIKYSVSFSSNGGGGSIQTQTVEEGKSTALPGPGTMYRNGYEFVSWNTSADGTGMSYAPGTVFTPVSDVMLYAQWKEEHTATDLSFNFNIQITKSYKVPVIGTVINAETGKSFAILEIKIRNNTIDIGFSPIAAAIAAFKLVSDDGDRYSFSLENTTKYSLSYTQILNMMLGKGNVSSTFYLVFEIPDEDANSAKLDLDWNPSGFTAGLDSKIALT